MHFYRFCQNMLVNIPVCIALCIQNTKSIWMHPRAVRIEKECIFLQDSCYIIKRAWMHVECIYSHVPDSIDAIGFYDKTGCSIKKLQCILHSHAFNGKSSLFFRSPLSFYWYALRYTFKSILHSFSCWMHVLQCIQKKGSNDLEAFEGAVLYIQRQKSILPAS